MLDHQDTTSNTLYYGDLDVPTQALVVKIDLLCLSEFLREAWNESQLFQSPLALDTLSGPSAPAIPGVQAHTPPYPRQDFR